MSDVSLVSSRFTVFRGSLRVGVIVPRSDGWAFVSCNSPFFTCFGSTPEEAARNAGFSL